MCRSIRFDPIDPIPIYILLAYGRNDGEHSHYIAFMHIPCSIEDRSAVAGWRTRRNIIIVIFTLVFSFIIIIIIIKHIYANQMDRMNSFDRHNH